MVRGSQVRFQSTKSTFLFNFYFTDFTLPPNRIIQQIPRTGSVLSFSSSPGSLILPNRTGNDACKKKKNWQPRADADAGRRRRWKHAASVSERLCLRQESRTGLSGSALFFQKTRDAPPSFPSLRITNRRHRPTNLGLLLNWRRSSSIPYST
jgi:hypothetical protein